MIFGSIGSDFEKDKRSGHKKTGPPERGSPPNPKESNYEKINQLLICKDDNNFHYLIP